jgi:F-type H+-transporting ATPase subunit b
VSCFVHHSRRLSPGLVSGRILGRSGPCIGALALGAAVLLVPALALASPAAHGDTGIEWVTPVFGNTGKLGLLWSFVNFAVLLWILEKILFKPLRNRTRTKHDTVKAEIDKATAAREEAEGVLAEVRGRLDRLDAEIAELMADAKAKAEADRARILEAARREAAQITAAAQAVAEREAAARRRQLEAEIVDRAVARAEALLASKITPADQRTMVDRYVEQLSAVDFGGRPS